MPTVAPYGSWRSPIDPAVVAAAGRRLASPTLADDGAVWWAEGRPTEGGRSGPDAATGRRRARKR